MSYDPDESDSQKSQMFKKVVEQLKESLRPRVKLLSLRENLPDPPVYKTKGAAGADLRSAVGLVLPPNSTRLVPTGYALALPDGYEAQVRSRSGLALRHSITVLNSPGTIDSDYRGEICVILRNHSDVHFEIEFGDRIAQLVIASVEQARFKSVAQLDDTARGKDGFGSTGND